MNKRLFRNIAIIATLTGAFSITLGVSAWILSGGSESTFGPKAAEKVCYVMDDAGNTTYYGSLASAIDIAAGTEGSQAIVVYPGTAESPKTVSLGNDSTSSVTLAEDDFLILPKEEYTIDLTADSDHSTIATYDYTGVATHPELNVYRVDGSNISEDEVPDYLKLGGELAKNVLTVKLNCEFNVEGEIHIGAVWNNPYGGWGFQGYITGEYAAIDLNGNTMNVDGDIDCHGVLTDSVDGNGIIVNSGGSVATNFCIDDYNGGTDALTKYGADQTPFMLYRIPYLDVKTTVNGGGRLLANCVLYALSAHNYTSQAIIGSSSALFNFDSASTGYVVHIPSSPPLEDVNYQEKVWIFAEVVTNSMSLAYGSTVLSTSNVYFPMNKYLSIDVYGPSSEFPTRGKASLTIQNKIKMLPGASVNFYGECAGNINASLTMYDEVPSTDDYLYTDYYLGGGTYENPSVNFYGDEAKFGELNICSDGISEIESVSGLFNFYDLPTSDNQVDSFDQACTFAKNDVIRSYLTSLTEYGTSSGKAYAVGDVVTEFAVSNYEEIDGSYVLRERFKKNSTFSYFYHFSETGNLESAELFAASGSLESVATYSSSSDWQIDAYKYEIDSDGNESVTLLENVSTGVDDSAYFDSYSKTPMLQIGGDYYCYIASLGHFVVAEYDSTRAAYISGNNAIFQIGESEFALGTLDETYGYAIATNGQAYAYPTKLVENGNTIWRAVDIYEGGKIICFTNEDDRAYLETIYGFTNTVYYFYFSQEAVNDTTGSSSKFFPYFQCWTGDSAYDIAVHNYRDYNGDYWFFVSNTSVLEYSGVYYGENPYYENVYLYSGLGQCAFVVDPQQTVYCYDDKLSFFRKIDGSLSECLSFKLDGDSENDYVYVFGVGPVALGKAPTLVEGTNNYTGIDCDGNDLFYSYTDDVEACYSIMFQSEYSSPLWVYGSLVSTDQSAVGGTSPAVVTRDGSLLYALQSTLIDGSYALVRGNFESLYGIEIDLYSSYELFTDYSAAFLFSVVYNSYYRGSDGYDITETYRLYDYYVSVGSFELELGDGSFGLYCYEYQWELASIDNNSDVVLLANNDDFVRNAYRLMTIDGDYYLLLSQSSCFFETSEMSSISSEYLKWSKVSQSQSDSNLMTISLPNDSTSSGKTILYGFYGAGCSVNSSVTRYWKCGFSPIYEYGDFPLAYFMESETRKYVLLCLLQQRLFYRNEHYQQQHLWFFKRDGFLW